MLQPLLALTVLVLAAKSAHNSETNPLSFFDDKGVPLWVLKPDTGKYHNRFTQWYIFSEPKIFILEQQLDTSDPILADVMKKQFQGREFDECIWWDRIPTERNPDGSIKKYVYKNHFTDNKIDQEPPTWKDNYSIYDCKSGKLINWKDIPSKIRLNIHGGYATKDKYRYMNRKLKNNKNTRTN